MNEDGTGQWMEISTDDPIIQKEMHRQNSMPKAYEDRGADGIAFTPSRTVTRINYEAQAEALSLLEQAGMPTGYIPNRAERRAMAKQMKVKEFKRGNKNG